MAQADSVDTDAKLRATCDFIEASSAVWREIDRLSAEPGGYRGLNESTELRRHERAAWERYRDLVLDAKDREQYREAIATIRDIARSRDAVKLEGPNGGELNLRRASDKLGVIASALSAVHDEMTRDLLPDRGAKDREHSA